MYCYYFLFTEKESTLKTAERKLLEEDLPKSKKRKRVPNKIYLDTQEETVEQVAKKVIYIYSFSRRFYPKRLTNEINRSCKTNSRKTIRKY